MSRARAVVCLSGGMDSTVCATLAARDYDSFGLHFSYGQRTQQRELQAARDVAKAVGLRS
jgi:7-cyano-7-deazaguanine synthase